MALTKEQRDALPEDDFAVPETRQLPMHDEKHVRMAWDMVDDTKGLSHEQRQRARHRILDRAKKLGVDTSGWSKFQAMQIEAMSLRMPQVDGHPNRMEFTGILVKLDEPSDKPPQGSGGRRIIMTSAAAKKSLRTLLGMAVDLTADLAGHDAQKKIGIITDAEVVADAKVGNHIAIKGFIYASDFPDAAARIRAMKELLGFSFEAKDISVADPGADPLVITECVFTGAAILRKDKAAYETTRIAAHAEDGATKDQDDMTKEEFDAALTAFADKQIKPLTEKLTALEAKAKEGGTVRAANLGSMVEPHAKALEACADGMAAAGIGGDDRRGHAAIARRMAAHLRAAAAQGRIPHIFEDYPLAAAADNKASEETKKDIGDLKAAIDGLGTQLKDLTAKAFTNAAAPARVSASAEVTSLLAKAGLSVADNKKLTVEQVDAAFKAAGIVGEKAIAGKLKLQAEGLITQAAA